MNTRTNTLSARFPLAGLAPLAVLGMVTTALSITRERQTLSDLDDHLLRDIGVTRDDADVETKRPVWDAPNRWLR